MVNILLKSAQIVDQQSEFHLQTKDILIQNGLITKIEDTIESDENITEISLENLHISQGWMDTSVSFGEPGYEDRETLANGLNTAAKSGFSTVCLNANTYPIIDTNTDVTFLKSKSENHPVTLLPIAALTKESKGVDLAEIHDMQEAGAIAFGDYQHPITNPNLLKIALQYNQNLNTLTLSFPINNDLKGKGIVNENVNSTRLGLKGIAAISEEIQITRDLQILDYTGGKLHIPTISSAGSVKLIKEAKKIGLDVSCSVAVHNLVLTDDVLEDFDTNYKVLPPLRTREDRQALLKGLQDGTIDFVTSDHNPLDIEKKNVEFDHAAYGTIGLESAFGALNSILDLEQVITILTQHKERFGASNESITVGNNANISLFNPKTEFTFTKDMILSKSKNSAFLGMTLKGKSYGIINNNLALIE